MALPHKILVIEDDPPFQRLLRSTLKSCGYKILQAVTGKDGLHSAEAHEPSVILVNRRLPDLDGIHIIAKLRQSSDVPIIVLCENGEEAIPALDALADDYIVKPFSKEEVVSRVRKAIVKSAPAPTQNAIFRLNDLEVDFIENRVFRHKKEIRLAPIEFKLLTHLIKSCGKLLSPENITQAIWGSEDGNIKKCLRAVIHELRRKVEDDPANPKYLTTEIGLGYRFRIS